MLITRTRLKVIKMTRKLLSVSAPGKVILHGEHSVVYGKTALAVSVDLRTSVVLSKIESKNNKDISQDKYLEINMKDLSAVYKFQLQRLIDLVVLPSTQTESETAKSTDESPGTEGSIEDGLLQKNILKLISETYFNISEGTKSGLIALLYLYLKIVVGASATIRSLDPLLIEISSKIPIGAGLGSSAAFAVSLAGAFYYYNRDVRKSSCPENNNISESEKHPRIIDQKFKNETILTTSNLANIAVQPSEPIINDISNDIDHDHSPSSKSSSGCISYCSSFASLSPPSTPSPNAKFNHMSEETDSCNETDDEEYLSITTTLNSCNTTKSEHDVICNLAFLAEKVIHGNPSGNKFMFFILLSIPILRP